MLRRCPGQDSREKSLETWTWESWAYELHPWDTRWTDGPAIGHLPWLFLHALTIGSLKGRAK